MITRIMTETINPPPGQLTGAPKILSLPQEWKDVISMVTITAISVTIFVSFWSVVALNVNTSLGRLPGPAQVLASAGGLWQEHNAERVKRKEFYARQAQKNSAALSADPEAEVKVRRFTGKPTFLDQIFTSLLTVFAGFVIASAIAIPVGVLCGLNRVIMTALNPFIQIFKPISPLAWLPIVTMVVSSVYPTNDGFLSKSFINSAITVALCSLWPTIINTALGVSSIDKDYINVARVLKLGFFPKVIKIIIPASLPLIFTGLRISLGVGWMVLIAAEMLAQNPGLGKFVWDEFQNGSSESLARIMVAVFTIGFIGFLLDRVMVSLQKAVSFGR